jgi:hypothetical protein
MGEGLDLAAVAGMAGLGGSAVAAIGSFIFFKGLILRILTQVIVTAALTFVGFIALLNFLGFQIVPREEPSVAMAVPQGQQSFTAQSAPHTVPDDGKKTYAVKSPWSKS